MLGRLLKWPHVAYLMNFCSFIYGDAVMTFVFPWIMTHRTDSLFILPDRRAWVAHSADCRTPQTPLKLSDSFSFQKASHRFFTDGLLGGSNFEDLLLQTGHSWDPHSFQNPRRQVLQKLWQHDMATGSLKMSQHTGQEKSSMGRDTFASHFSHFALLERQAEFAFTFKDSPCSFSELQFSGMSIIFSSICAKTLRFIQIPVSWWTLFWFWTTGK